MRTRVRFLPFAGHFYLFYCASSIAPSRKKRVLRHTEKKRSSMVLKKWLLWANTLVLQWPNGECLPHLPSSHCGIFWWVKTGIRSYRAHMGGLWWFRADLRAVYGWFTGGLWPIYKQYMPFMVSWAPSWRIDRKQSRVHMFPKSVDSISESLAGRHCEGVIAATWIGRRKHQGPK
jgi:hypothetical protein